ncbi:MAG TPA: nucleotidyltransferase family protein [Roseiflexaceae bacterium]|nr:nucleotidyltransferase family protein [Roseiflexaceae bacterium]HMP41604.1 nucleotidyltransferase family protein [Roseiflexaceae bacterium]
MKALVLAAGAGTRLRPLTDTCPKPMLPVAGRPLLAWTLSWLRRYGVVEAALNLHHLPDVVRTGLGDGGAFDMRLHYAYEPELRGTAGAIHNFPGFFDQPFLVIYGDLLLDLDLADLIGFHREQGAVMTLALKRTAMPQSQGMIETGADGRIVRFVEKPLVWDGGDTANAGVYVCEPAIAARIPPGVSDFGHDIIPALLAGHAPVYGRPLSGYLLDIGTPAAYEQAQHDWQNR